MSEGNSRFTQACVPLLKTKKKKKKENANAFFEINIMSFFYCVRDL